MSYGNGAGKNMEKRMVDLGQISTFPDLAELRSKCLVTLRKMASEAYPSDIIETVADGKDLDNILLTVQKDAVSSGTGSVWAEKCRIMAKSAVQEQWKRGQKNLFGRFKHISTRGDKPMKDGHMRLVNMAEEMSRALSDGDIAHLQDLADVTNFPAAMDLFAQLRDDNAGLSPLQADCLRSLHADANARWGAPQWRDDATVQLHLDYRCIRGGKELLAGAQNGISKALKEMKPTSGMLPIASHRARGDAIPLQMFLSKDVSCRMEGHPQQELKSFAIEIGPELTHICGTVIRPKTAEDAIGRYIVMAEDFGYAKTSSIVILRSSDPITPERIEFAQSKPGKKEVKDYLENHISGDEIEVLEKIQFCGRNFLNRIKEAAKKIDSLRSEIDLAYNRLERIRREINLIAGREPRALVPIEAETVSGSNMEQARYASMHARFFRLLGGINKLKAKRRGTYAAVAGLKKSWLGYIINIKARLAQKYGAVALREDLTVLAIPIDDPDYKGRTFNKMMNNGSKGQYIRRSDNKMAWKGIVSLALPSAYSSTTDWRNACVDKKQRKGSVFTGRDGVKWDADEHASEMLGRWLFLRPKEMVAQAAL